MTCCPMLSILIPTFNDDCRELVKGLVSQTKSASLTDWEIIVADDGSTDDSVVVLNETLNEIPGCCFIRRKKTWGVPPSAIFSPTKRMENSCCS